MAFLFDGVSGRIETNFNTSATQRSFSVWIDRHGAGESGNGVIFSRGGSIEYLHTTASQIRYERNWSGGQAVWGFTFSSSGWHHIGVSYDAGASTNDPVLYLDGVAQSLATDSNSSGTLTSTSQSYMLGNTGFDTLTFDGSIAEFVAWDAILTADDFAMLADSCTPLRVKPASLASYMPLVHTLVDRKIPTGEVTTQSAWGYTVADHPRIFSPGLKPVGVTSPVAPPAEEEEELEVTLVPVVDFPNQQTIVVDDFNRADENPLVGDPHSGTWSQWATDDQLQLVSNQVAAPAPWGHSIWVPSMPADMEAYVEIGTINDWVGIYARYDPALGQGYDVFFHPTEGWGIDRSGPGAVLATAAGPIVSAGDALGIRCIGSRIEAWARVSGVWQLVTAATDTTHAGTGTHDQVILEIWGTTTRLDNFAAGEAVASPLELTLTPVSPS